MEHLDVSDILWLKLGANIGCDWCHDWCHVSVHPPTAFVCPDALQYQACLSACTSQSCPNHDFDSDPSQCSGLTEGCTCPGGTLLHRPYSALCISPEKCGKTQRYFCNSMKKWNLEKKSHISNHILNVFDEFFQPAPTAPGFLVHTARCGKHQRMPAAGTAVTMTPSSPSSMTAPTRWCQCAVEWQRWSSAWLMTPAAAHGKSAVRPWAAVWLEMIHH